MTYFTAPYEDELPSAPSDAPVFPLPNAVLLPGEPMPLYIFEDRYRAMTENALAGDRLIVMGHMKPGWEKKGASVPPLYDVAGVGRIVMDERASDGTFNLVLLGLKRVRIGNFVQESPYRRAQIELLTDRYSQTSPSLITTLESELIELAKKSLKARAGDLPEYNAAQFLEQLAPGGVPLGMLCDMVGSTVLAQSAEKQMLLEETDVIRRAEKLIFALRFLSESSGYGGPGKNLLH